MSLKDKAEREVRERNLKKLRKYLGLREKYFQEYCDELERRSDPKDKSLIENIREQKRMIVEGEERVYTERVNRADIEGDDLDEMIEGVENDLGELRKAIGGPQVRP